MVAKRRSAALVLEDDSVFLGYSFGARKAVSGELVFNTGMVGYAESMSDPSYHGQILVFTYPLIGNYGVPGDETEESLLRYFQSDRIHVRGLIVADITKECSHWNAARSLPEWMQEHEVPGVYDVDTRQLTKKLRDNGTMLGKIVYGSDSIPFQDPNARNLAAEVSIREPIVYPRGKKRVIVVDCGVKNSILKAFLRRNITVIRVPWDHDFLKERAHGVVISNGPGDPRQCTATIENVARAMSRSIPLLGICLGSQIMGLAAGARTFKLKYGHRGHNQPCVEAGTKRCYITSQNHGYAVDPDTLPGDWRQWFYNNNDDTNEGIIHVSKPFLGTQFHPEASPGPDDTEFLFDLFLRGI